MADRSPARPGYDVALGVTTGSGFAIVKLAYAIDPAKRLLRQAPAVPLVNDIHDDALKPRLPAHSDFWPSKRLADLAVIGSAHAPDGIPVRSMEVRLAAGGRVRRLAVHGERAISFAAGVPRIAPAEPFTTMPLGIERAYGGLDLRAEHDPDDHEQVTSVAIGADWPGLYPRNPWGRGYLCVPDRVDGQSMPTQEDPDDPLDGRRLVALPRLWHQQPMPAYLDWTPINCFPRNIHLAIENEAWFPPPDDNRLAEVRLGLLPEGYRSVLADQFFGNPPHWRFRQEAAPGLSFEQAELLRAPVRIEGMHPQFPSIAFALPPPPVIEMKFEQRREAVAPALTSVEIRPSDLLVTLTWTAEIQAPRPFIPGIHRHIPLAVSVGGDRAVHYEAPPPINAAPDTKKETTG